VARASSKQERGEDDCMFDFCGKAKYKARLMDNIEMYLSKKRWSGMD
jgi:hypothetical protein